MASAVTKVGNVIVSGSEMQWWEGNVPGTSRMRCSVLCCKGASLIGLHLEKRMKTRAVVGEWVGPFTLGG
jgi:hypothetical protein